MDICKLRKDVWSVFESKRNRVVLPNTPYAVARYWNGRYCFCLKTDRYDEYVEEFSSCRLELEDMDDGRYLIFSTDELSDAFIDMAFGSLLVLDNPERRREIASNPEIFYDETGHMLGNSFTEDRVASKIAELYVYLKLRENGIEAVFGGFEKKSLHDINCGEYVIEVKSTQKHHEWPITTNQEQMMSHTDGADLYLCLVRLEPTEAYGDNVYSIDKLVKSLGEYSGTDSLPNMPRNSSVRGKRFLVQEVRILRVTQSFPRPYLEGNGAKLTNYTLNLDPDALGAQDFGDFLKQKGKPGRVQEFDSEESAINEEDDAGTNEVNESTPSSDSDDIDGTTSISSPSNDQNNSPEGLEGKRTFEDVVNDYNDFKGEMVSGAQLEAEGLKAYGIADIKNGMTACVGIGFRNGSEICEFVRLRKLGYREALRFVAAKIFCEHHDAMYTEARKSREERRRNTPNVNLKDLAMSVEELGRDAEKTTVFWLGGKDEAERPVVNLKLSAEDIAKFIGALIVIPIREDSEKIAKQQQVVFFLKVKEADESSAHNNLAVGTYDSAANKAQSEKSGETSDTGINTETQHTPYTFCSHGHQFVFDNTRIFHCVENDWRYVAALFTYNGVKGNYIKFCQRRVKNGWGSFIGKPKICQIQPALFINLTTFPSTKFKDSTFDVQSATYQNEYQKLLGEWLHGDIRGMRKMSYEEEIVDVRREVIWLSLPTMVSMYGAYKRPPVKELTSEELYDVMKEYDLLNGISS